MSTTELVRCLACGVMNRVPVDAGARGRRAVCGRCKRPLGASAVPVKVTDATFATEVEQSTLPVVVDLWAAWCGPCRMVAPIMEDLATEYAGRLRVGKIDVDAQTDLARAFGVSSIPMIVLMKNGEPVSHALGARPKAALVQALQLEEHLPAHAA
jgi:thioredoxin